MACIATAGALGLFRRGPSPAGLVSLVAASAPLSDADAGHIRLACWPGNPRGLTPQQDAELIDAILKRQADVSRSWHWLLSNALEARAAASQLTQAQLARYATAACPRPTLSTDPTSQAFWMPGQASANAREVPLYIHSPQGRSATASALRQRLMLSSIRVNGTSIPDFTTTPLLTATTVEPAAPATPYVEGGEGGGSMPVPVALAAGTYPLTYHIRRTVTWPGLAAPLLEDEWDICGTITVGH